jgi:hypothetical protein
MATTVRRSRVVVIIPLIVVFLTLVNCDKHSNPAAPTPIPDSGSPTPLSMAIGGTTSLDHPGETGRLIATVKFSDNTARDVTAEASWVGHEGVITMTGPGMFTAERYGTGSVSARYGTLSATAQVRVAPAGAFLIAGSVTAAGGFRLSEARVEFSSGCGTHRTTTDMFGSYVLPAVGQATMRAEREGLRGQVKQMMVQTDGRVDFELQSLDTAGDLSGSFKLTVTASPSCVLPPEVMQRRYDATILQLHQELFVLLTGANLVAWGGQTGFSGRREQNAVRFVVRDTFDDGYNFIERIAGTSTDGTDLYYAGTAVGAPDQTRIVAVFNGKLELRRGSTTIAKCEAGDHRFELMRVGGS